jgi:hypothetical protein
MRHIKFFLLTIVAVIFMSGCFGAKHVPKFAFTDPEKGVSVLHPDQMEKQTDRITTITVILESGLLVEADGLAGAWPVLVEVDDKIREGFCYCLIKRSKENPWGILIAEYVFLGGVAELKGRKIIGVNQDGGAWAISPTGEFVSQSDGGFDSEKFEEDLKYRRDIFQRVGKTPEEIDDFWWNFLSNQGIALAGDFSVTEEIIIGSPKWKTYRKNLLSEMGHDYVMPDGEIRTGHVSRKELQKMVAVNPRMTGWQRFMDALFIPLAPSPEAIVFGMGSSLLKGGIAALMSSHWNGKTARAECQRRDLASQMRFLTGLYQNTLRKQNDEIRYLREQQGGGK